MDIWLANTAADAVIWDCGIIKDCGQMIRGMGMFDELLFFSLCVRFGTLKGGFLKYNLRSVISWKFSICK